MPRRRSGKLKVQHHFLEGLEKYLEEIQSWEVVESIIPGRIVRQNRTSVQEVFVVCGDHGIFEKLFRERFG